MYTFSCHCFSCYRAFLLCFNRLYSIPPPVDTDPMYTNLFFTILRLLSGFVYTFHMPLFFILSGAVFALYVFKNGKKRNINLREIIYRKTKRLLLPYCLYGVLFMIPIKFMMNWYQPGSSLITEIFQFLINGKYPGHLWFLFSLFTIFVVVSLLVLYFKLNSTHSIASMLLTGIALTWIFNNQALSFPHSFEIYNIFSKLYLICFLLGLIFGYYLPLINSLTTQQKALRLSIFFFGIYLFSFVLLFKYPFKAILGLYYATLIFLGLYFLFKYLCSYSYTKRLLNNRLSHFFFSNLMGIYLLHDPLNYVILYLSSSYHWLETSWGVCLFYFSRTIGLFILCAALSQFISIALSKWKNLMTDKV